MNKTEIAKKTYNDFWNGMKTSNETEYRHIPSYVYLNNGDVIQDFHWSNKDPTPTSFYRWVMKYNIQHRPRTKWAHTVKIVPEKYKKLLDSIEPGFIKNDEPLRFDDVLVEILK